MDPQSRGASLRASLEHQNPLVAGPVTAGKSSEVVLPNDQFSLVSLDSDEVIVWAVKPSEDGIENGLVVRLWNLSLIHI